MAGIPAVIFVLCLVCVWHCHGACDTSGSECSGSGATCAGGCLVVALSLEDCLFGTIMTYESGKVGWMQPVATQTSIEPPLRLLRSSLV